MAPITKSQGVSNPNDPDWALYESAALLPRADAILAGLTFEQWLSGQIARKS